MRETAKSRERNRIERQAKMANIDREKVEFTIRYIDANGKPQQQTVTGITSLNITKTDLSRSGCKDFVVE